MEELKFFEDGDLLIDPCADGVKLVMDQDTHVLMQFDFTPAQAATMCASNGDPGEPGCDSEISLNCIVLTQDTRFLDIETEMALILLAGVDIMPMLSEHTLRTITNAISVPEVEFDCE